LSFERGFLVSFSSSGDEMMETGRGDEGEKERDEVMRGDGERKQFFCVGFVRERERGVGTRCVLTLFHLSRVNLE
jgi:hypothetical protein